MEIKELESNKVTLTVTKNDAKCYTADFESVEEALVACDDIARYFMSNDTGKTLYVNKDTEIRARKVTISYVPVSEDVDSLYIKHLTIDIRNVNTLFIRNGLELKTI
jgi:translation elongation factor P/translation initiation factor 5A